MFNTLVKDLIFIVRKMANVLLIGSSNLEVEKVKRQFLKNKIVHVIHVASDGLEALSKLKGINGFKKIEPPPYLILFNINQSEMELLSFINLLRLDDLLDKLKIFVMIDSGYTRIRVKELDVKICGCIIKPLSFKFNKFFVKPSSIDNFGLFVELIRSQSNIQESK